jgi:hypothetical protein
LIDPSSPIKNDLWDRISIGSSILVGLSVSYSAYVLFLQTPQISKTDLALAVVLFLAFSSASYLLIRTRLKGRLGAVLVHKTYAVSICFLIPLLFLPLFYISPVYPVSPLLRQWTDLAVQYDIQADSAPVAFPKASVRLQMNKIVLDAQSFALVGVWKSAKDTFSLDPASTASLHWVGAASDTITLTLLAPPAHGILTVYWDQSRTSFELSPGTTEQIVLVRKFSIPFGINTLFFFSTYIILVWLLFFLLVLWRGKIKPFKRLQQRGIFSVLLILLALTLGAVTVKLQVDSLEGGVSYLHGEQMLRHNNVLNGQAQDPWQYRIFSEVVVEGVVRLFHLLPLQDPISDGLISLRILQNIAIFLLAFALYLRISDSKGIAILGVILLATSMKNAFYDNDLSFNTYFDVIFYLIAVLLIVNRSYYWMILLMLFAALNRETSGLIPFLMLAGLMDERGTWFKKSLPFIIGLAVFGMIFFGLRFLFPNRPLYIPYGVAPGFPMLIYNVTRSFTWQQLFHTLGFIPFIGLFFYFVWPSLWQRFLLILFPIWFVVHFVLSVAAETRLFLVPLSIIFIPGILFMLQHLRNYQFARGENLSLN